MTEKDFRDVLQAKFKIAVYNVKHFTEHDGLNGTGTARYWEGYKQALLEVMGADVMKSLDK